MAPEGFFVRPLDRQTIAHHESLRARKLKADPEDDTNALRFDALVRCRSVWSSLIDKLETGIAAGVPDEDDVVDLEKWEVIEDKGRLRRQVEEENRLYTRQQERRRRRRERERTAGSSAAGRATSETGCEGDDDDEGAWSDASDDELAILQTPTVDRRRSSPPSEAPVSAAYKRVQQRRMEELEDLRSFLQQEMALRLHRPSTPHSLPDEEPDLGRALDDLAAGHRNTITELLPPEERDFSDDDLDLVRCTILPRAAGTDVSDLADAHNGVRRPLPV